MKLVDLTGQRFGRLVVVERAPNRGTATVWRCRCDCGSSHEVRGTSLRSAARPTRSCGCMERERRIDRTSTDLVCSRPTTRYPGGRTGTQAGYLAHYYLDDKPCPTCIEGARRETAARLAADPTARLRYVLWTKYRLTVERYLDMLEEQGYGCAICGSDSPGDVRANRFHIDHDHRCCPGSTSCGQCVRGLLCRGCNTALGNFGDDRQRLLNAARYLAEHEARTAPDLNLGEAVSSGG